MLKTRILLSYVKRFRSYFVSLQPILKILYGGKKVIDMGQILRDMTAQERAFYEEDCKKFPWLKTVKMSDDEFLAYLMSITSLMDLRTHFDIYS